MVTISIATTRTAAFLYQSLYAYYTEQHLYDIIDRYLTACNGSIFEASKGLSNFFFRDKYIRISSDDLRLIFKQVIMD